MAMRGYDIQKDIFQQQLKKINDALNSIRVISEQGPSHNFAKSLNSTLLFICESLTTLMENPLAMSLKELSQVWNVCFDLVDFFNDFFRRYWSIKTQRNILYNFALFPISVLDILLTQYELRFPGELTYQTYEATADAMMNALNALVSDKNSSDWHVLGYAYAEFALRNYESCLKEQDNQHSDMTGVLLNVLSIKKSMINFCEGESFKKLQLIRSLYDSSGSFCQQVSNTHQDNVSECVQYQNFAMSAWLKAISPSSPSHSKALLLDSPNYLSATNLSEICESSSTQIEPRSETRSPLSCQFSRIIDETPLFEISSAIEADQIESEVEPMAISSPG